MATQQRRGVHWDEDHRDAVLQSLSLNGRSVERRRRDGTLSAAATLNLYLSDALRDTERRSPPHRLQVKTDADDSGPATEPVTRSARPESPMSRFLQQRLQREGRLQMPHAGEHKTRSLRLSSLSTGSMELLLREKINEAKKIREPLRQSIKGDENQPLNHHPQLGVGNITSAVMPGSPHLSTAVPMPHPKPCRPLLQVYTSVDPYSGDHLPITHKRKTKDTEEEAQRIQRAWREFTKRRQREAKSLVETTIQLCESEPTTEQNCTTDGTASELNTSTNAFSSPEVHCSADLPVASLNNCQLNEDEEVNNTIRETGIQTDLIDLVERENSTDNEHVEPDTKDHNVCVAVKWEDDEWSFLEEGRYPTNELLESSVHVEDRNIETLVWKKPHIAVQLHEAKRQELERARRAVPSKKSVDQTTLAPELMTQSAKKTPVRVQLRKPRGRRPRTSRLRIEKSKKTNQSMLVETEDPSNHSEAIVECKSESNGVPDDDVYATMLAQLHRYVVFSDTPITADSNLDSDVRNDIIRVPDAGSEGWPDHDLYLSRPNGRIGSNRSIVVDNVSADSESELEDCVPTVKGTGADMNQERPEPSDMSLQLNESETLLTTEYQLEKVIENSLSRFSLFQANDSTSSSVTASSPFDTAKQREFQTVLDAFQQSLRASSSTPSRFSLDQLDDASDKESEDSDSAVDAELEAMLREIQRCKEQIALARRQASPATLDAGIQRFRSVTGRPTSNPQQSGT